MRVRPARAAGRFRAAAIEPHILIQRSAGWFQADRIFRSEPYTATNSPPITSAALRGSGAS